MLILVCYNFDNFLELILTTAQMHESFHIFSDQVIIEAYERVIKEIELF